MHGKLKVSVGADEKKPPAAAMYLRVNLMKTRPGHILKGFFFFYYFKINFTTIKGVFLTFCVTDLYKFNL